MAGATPMLLQQFQPIVEPILNEAFDGIYNQRKDEYLGFTKIQQGTPRLYHEEPILYGFGPAPVFYDGSPIEYDSGGFMFQARYTYIKYGLAFAITQTLMSDGEHINIGSIYAKHLGQSLIERKELNGANLLNNAFNSSFQGGDSVSLINSSHPMAPNSVGGATWSNQLTTAAALSQSSLEQMLIQIKQAQDFSGKYISLVPEALVVSPNNMFQATVILNSVLRTGTANNDINAIKQMGDLFPQGVKVVTRLTSNTAWFVPTNAPEGLKCMMRQGLERTMFGDFDTDSLKYKATERYVFGWTDPHGIYGTAGV